MKLNLTKENFLGIKVVGRFYLNSLNDGINGIYISSIANGSIVKQDGRIDVGDLIIQVF